MHCSEVENFEQAEGLTGSLIPAAQSSRVAAWELHEQVLTELSSLTA